MRRELSSAVCSFKNFIRSATVCGVRCLRVISSSAAAATRSRDLSASAIGVDAFHRPKLRIRAAKASNLSINAAVITSSSSGRFDVLRSSSNCFAFMARSSFDSSASASSRSQAAALARAISSASSGSGADSFGGLATTSAASSSWGGSGSAGTKNESGSGAAVASARAASAAGGGSARGTLPCATWVALMASFFPTRAAVTAAARLSAVLTTTAPACSASALKSALRASAATTLAALNSRFRLLPFNQVVDPVGLNLTPAKLADHSTSTLRTASARSNSCGVFDAATDSKTKRLSSLVSITFSLLVEFFRFDLRDAASVF